MHPDRRRKTAAPSPAAPAPVAPAPATREHDLPVVPWITLLCGGLVTALSFLSPAAFELWSWNRELIWSGEIWRLLSGHFVHTDLGHLGLNLAALSILGVRAELGRHKGDPSLVFLLPSAAFVTSIALGVAVPDLAVYGGLSAPLNAVFAALLVRQWWRTPDPWVLALGFVGLVKIGLEWIGGGLPADATGFAWGLIAGLRLAAGDHAAAARRTAPGERP